MVKKNSMIFIIGGLVYYCIELLWRGHSAWQMCVVGGLCFLLIGLINELFDWTTPLWLQSIVATAIVTVIEYISGLFLNVWLGLGIWNYSNLPLNLNGQICLYFCFAWLGLSIFAIVLDDWLRYWLFGEDKPRYKLL